MNIFGRGEVHPDGRGAGVWVRRSKNVRIDGIVVSQLPIGQCDSVELTNVKSISYYGWGDGMDVFSSSNVILDGVFCRNSDDCAAVYASTQGFKGGSNNVLVKNATLWADVAHPINIGGHGDPNGMDTVQNVTFRNIDILDQAEKQIDYQGCLAINPGDNTLVRNITFENIRIEDFRNGQLVNFRISFNPKYCVSTGRGIQNVLGKDVTYNGSGENLSIIAGGSNNVLVKNATLWADVAHPINIGGHGDPNGMDTVQNVTFRNIDILDQAEKQIDYQGCLAINPGDNTLVRNITFENIRIEDFRNGQLVNFRISFNPKYCVSTGRGIQNVLVKDVTYNGSGENLSIIAGYDENHKISGIRFVNLVVNGRKITDDMPGKPKWYKTGDMAGIFVGEHVENLSFE